MLNAIRSLDARASEGIVRSVWPVANELAADGDGTCAVIYREAQFVCDTRKLSTALSYA